MDRAALKDCMMESMEDYQQNGQNRPITEWVDEWLQKKLMITQEQAMEIREGLLEGITIFKAERERIASLPGKTIPAIEGLSENEAATLNKDTELLSDAVSAEIADIRKKLPDIKGEYTNGKGKEKN